MAAMTREAFLENIKSHTLHMYRLAFSILRNPQDAEDAVSEAVLRAYENRGALRSEERFKAWVLQITANEAKKLYGKNKRMCTVAWEDYMSDQMSDYMSPAFYDEHHELWDAVMKLDDEFRDVIVLFYYEQFAIKEIAKILKCREGTVKSRLHRAKGQLREMLQEQ